jgi:hypothetical protein
MGFLCKRCGDQLPGMAALSLHVLACEAAQKKLDAATNRTRRERVERETEVIESIGKRKRAALNRRSPPPGPN